MHTRFGLKTSFIDEGKFKARVLADDEEFPLGEIDVSDIEVPVSTQVAASLNGSIVSPHRFKCNGFLMLFALRSCRGPTGT